MNVITVEGKTATEVARKAIKAVEVEGTERTRFGGTIPSNIKDPNSPWNRDRQVKEVPFFCAELTNPTANWTDIGNQTFITIAEQLDHMNGDNPGMVVRYSDMYKTWQDRKSGRLPPTYGERLRLYPIFGGTTNQVTSMIQRLKANPSSRKATASLSLPVIDNNSELPPCNIFFQASVEDGKLSWTTINRSLDLYNGITENMFMFSTWQREVAMALGLEAGPYRTISSNAHLYTDNKINVNQPDVYDTVKPVAPKVSYYNVFAESKSVDASLIAGNFGEVNKQLEKISNIDSYWGMVKTTMAIDWYLKVEKNPENVTSLVNGIKNAPWEQNVLKRIEKAEKLVTAKV